MGEMKVKAIKTLCMGAVLLTMLFTAGNVDASLSRPWGDSASLSELQYLFDGIGSTIDAVNDQSTEALFEPTGTGNSVASYVATISFEWPELEFGIYSMDDPNQRVPMFYESTATAGDSIVVQFDLGADYVRVVDLDTLSVLSSTNYFKEFGFYAITTTTSGTSGPFYSEDHLNPGGFAHFLTYEGKGDDVTIGTSGTYSDIDHWYVAVEGGTATDTTEEDFSDFVVQMESITPIPEPASIGLIALMTGGIFFVRRFFHM
jgi:hypothetical protein